MPTEAQPESAGRVCTSSGTRAGGVQGGQPPRTGYDAAGRDSRPEHTFAFSVRSEWQIRAMDREALAVLLKQGLSLAEIGRRFGRDESTVGYWVAKHGLEAVHAAKHASRGGLTKERLEVMVNRGDSVRTIAKATGYSPTAVRYWLKRHGLATVAAGRRADGHRARMEARLTALMNCPTHGETEFFMEARGAYRCLRCRRERVANRRRRIKEILVAEAGGACVLCGYDRFVGALHFHHLDPATKSFTISNQGITRSLDVMRSEAAKCKLVCANCHAEIEADLQTLEEGADKVFASGAP